METYDTTRRVFLRALALAYLAAFSSLWVEFPGLYGRDGLVPVHNTVKDNGFHKSYINMIPAFNKLGMTPDIYCEGVCLLGMLVSAVAATGWFCNAAVFFVLWSFYYSLFSIGEVFLHFQWDILLMEVGFTAILFAPTTGLAKSRAHPSVVWLYRFVLFKFMLMSGAVKLQAGCPTWQNLTALNYHYATTCIPGPLAWYAAQMPDLFHKFSVAANFFIEGPGTYLILVPFRGVRHFAALLQIQLQVMIIVTGNYGFFNFLTIVLCLPLLDDAFWTTARGRIAGLPRALLAGVGPKTVLFLAGFVAWSCWRWFEVTTRPHGPREGWWMGYDIRMTYTAQDLKKEFDFTLRKAMGYVGAVIVVTGLHHACLELLGSRPYENSPVRCARAVWRGLFRVLRCTKSIGLTCVVVAVFAAHTTTFAAIHEDGLEQKYPPAVREILHDIQEVSAVHYIANSYGLFRRMTGVGPSTTDKYGREVTKVERPEVIIEGSDDGNIWHEYEFHYKPGDPGRALPQVAPFHPRVDWQLWFAALGTWRQSPPWFLHLIHKLLCGSPNVLKFVSHNPFAHNHPPAPKWVRAQLYHYEYQPADPKLTGWVPQPKGGKWWKRTFVKEYLPAIFKDHPDVVNIFNNFGFTNKFQYPPDKESKELTENRASRYIVEARREYGETQVVMWVVALPLALAVWDVVRFVLVSAPAARAAAVGGPKVKFD